MPSRLLMQQLHDAGDSLQGAGGHGVWVCAGDGAGMALGGRQGGRYSRPIPCSRHCSVCFDKLLPQTNR